MEGVFPQTALNFITVAQPAPLRPAAYAVRRRLTGVHEHEAKKVHAAFLRDATSPQKTTATMPISALFAGALLLHSHRRCRRRSAEGRCLKSRQLHACAALAWPECAATPDILEQTLPEDPNLKRGVLANGLRYVLLQHGSPANRFEAHLDIHAGSVDERDDQQGMAHILEHICFLGSDKRTRLFGTGVKSNALTDFQHTVYHAHAPVQRENGAKMLPPVLEALCDIAFVPRFAPARLEKERKAVLNEMQQVNTLEYRIETWTLSGLHSENQLGRRFPIGLEEQIRGWTVDDCKEFYDEWYHPGNATLYLVGDLPVDEMHSTLEHVFATVPARQVSGDVCVPPAWGPESVDPTSLFRRKLPTPRPKHMHRFSVPQIGTTAEFTAAADFNQNGTGGACEGPVVVVRNELLSNVQIYLYAKAPVRPKCKVADLRFDSLLQLVLNVLRLKLLVLLRYDGHNASVDLDHSDSFREGCAVTSIKVTADTLDWQVVLTKVVQEARAFVEHGVTEAELQRFSVALEKAVETEAMESASMPSEDVITNLMSSDTFGHAVMQGGDALESRQQVMRTFSQEELKVAAEWMLGFIAHYGSSKAPPAAAVILCMPTRTFNEATGEVVDIPAVTEEGLQQLLRSVPDKDPKEAMNPVDIPDALCPEEKLQVLLGSNYVDNMHAYLATARHVDLDTGIVQLRLPNGSRVSYVHTQNSPQGSMKLLFPGGRTAERPDAVGAATLGARTLEESGTVADFSNQQIEMFAVTTGLCVMIECDKEHMHVDCLYPVSDKDGMDANLQLMHLLLREPRWDGATFERAKQACKVAGQEVLGSLELATEEAFLSVMHPHDTRVLQPSAEALADMSLDTARSCIESQVFNRLDHMEIVVAQDFELLGRALTPGAKAPRLTNNEGDTSAEEEAAKMRERAQQALEEGLWRFLGSVPSKQESSTESTDVGPPLLRPFESVYAQGCNAASDLLRPPMHHRHIHLRDPEERAYAIVGGGAPNCWGVFGEGHAELAASSNFCWDWDIKRPELTSHKAYPLLCLLMLKDVLSCRLNGTLRERMGLAYSVTFELSLFNLVQGGWFQARVSSMPSRIKEALAAAKQVITDVAKKPINMLEIASSCQHLQRKHQNEMHSNEYWTSLLANLQSDTSNKDITCIRDVAAVLQQLGPADVQNAWRSLLTGEDQLFTAIGTQGPNPN